MIIEWFTHHFWRALVQTVTSHRLVLDAINCGAMCVYAWYAVSSRRRREARRERRLLGENYNDLSPAKPSKWSLPDKLQNRINALIRWFGWEEDRDY
jgi:hypothetical protein